jgi:transposase
MVVLINPLLRSLIIELVNLYFPKKKKGIPGRPITCSNKECLKAAFKVLKNGTGWEYLDEYSIKGDSIRKRIAQWNKKNIFKKAWIITVNIYIEFGLNFEDLFIDASHIKNYNGKDIIGKNYYDRFKTSTKLTTITDKSGIPIGITLGCGNKHDLTFVEEALDSIDLDRLDHMDCQYLIADKGYWSDDVLKKIENKYKLELITPSMRSREEGREEKKRIKELNKVKHKIRVEERKLEQATNELKSIKNHRVNKRKAIRIEVKNKIKNHRINIKRLNADKKIKERIKKKRGRKSKRDKKLAKRYVVELTFSWFKKYDRLVIRKDKNFSSFEGFIFFGAGNIVARSLAMNT